MAQPDFDQLERIRACLIAEWAHRGVIRVEFTTSFIAPFDSAVWLGTDSDTERNALLDLPNLLELVRTAIRSSGLDPSSIVGATAQSQETVDRDHRGSWFYALR